MDQDGDLDLVVLCDIDARIQILENAGNGTFPTSVALAAGRRPTWFAVGDLDVDGDADVAILDNSENRVSILSREGNGTFTLGAPYGTGDRPFAVVVGDLDRDGDGDLAVTNFDQTVLILRNCASTGTSFCAGDGSGAACPCGNDSAHGGGAGCRNSAGTGATLHASGGASLVADSLVLVTAGERPTATSVVFQGRAAAPPVVFGQGLRCITGQLKRLYVKAAVGGSVVVPEGSDPSVSARSAQRGDTIAPGGFRYYGVYYRDPIVLGGCSSASTFNVTSQLAVYWAP
jgi:hypothetical protein